MFVQKELDVARVHDFSDDRHVELICRLAQKVEALGAHSLVGIWGGARLKGAAAQHGRTGLFDASGNANEVFALNGARACDNLEVPGADLHSMAAVDRGVFGMKLAVCFFERFGDAFDLVDDIHGFK